MLARRGTDGAPACAGATGLGGKPRFGGARELRPQEGRPWPRVAGTEVGNRAPSCLCRQASVSPPCTGQSPPVMPAQAGIQSVDAAPAVPKRARRPCSPAAAPTGPPPARGRRGSGVSRASVAAENFDRRRGGRGRASLAPKSGSAPPSCPRRRASVSPPCTGLSPPVLPAQAGIQSVDAAPSRSARFGHARPPRHRLGPRLRGGDASRRGLSAPASWPPRRILRGTWPLAWPISWRRRVRPRPFCRRRPARAPARSAARRAALPSPPGSDP